MTYTNLHRESRANKIFAGCILGMTFLLAILLAVVMHHDVDARTTWRIAITNWPGFDPLYLAEQKGFFKQNGLDITLVPINSLTDMRTAFERGDVDGYTASIMDVVEALQYAQAPGKVVMVTDYSNGGDVLVADPAIGTAGDIHGQPLSLEITDPVARYMLNRFMGETNLRASDMVTRPFGHSIVVDQFVRKAVEMAVTYEPYASFVREHRDSHVLFSSAQLPREILHGVVTSPDMLKGEKDLSQHLQAAWQNALDYMTTNPGEAEALLAQRYGVSVPEYKAMLAEVTFFKRTDIQIFAAQNGVHKDMRRLVGISPQRIEVTEGAISDSVAIWQQAPTREARR